MQAVRFRVNTAYQKHTQGQHSACPYHPMDEMVTETNLLPCAQEPG